MKYRDRGEESVIGFKSPCAAVQELFEIRAVPHVRPNRAQVHAHLAKDVRNGPVPVRDLIDGR